MEALQADEGVLVEINMKGELEAARVHQDELEGLAAQAAEEIDSEDWRHEHGEDLWESVSREPLLVLAHDLQTLEYLREPDDLARLLSRVERHKLQALAGHLELPPAWREAVRSPAGRPREHGEELVAVSLRIPASLRAAVSERARAEGITLSDAVRVALESAYRPK